MKEKTRSERRRETGAGFFLRKGTALLLCLLLLAALCAGCGGKPQDPDADPWEQDPYAVPSLPVDDMDPAWHYSMYYFQPKVCSSFMEDLFGREMKETWYALVDAVMAGEDHFPCPDEETYRWVIGRFPEKCFPLLGELIGFGDDPDSWVKDGVAEFTYRIPVEEVPQRIDEFAELVEGILNYAMDTGCSDLEKALSLYVYFYRTYEYDYAAADSFADDQLSSFRFLIQGKGVSREISDAYSYLLLQAGVDAGTMSAGRTPDRSPHQWSYVRINGSNFHIDPAYAIGDPGSLAYFMMTDARMEYEDSRSAEEFIICSDYAEDHPHRDYSAYDETFAPLWEGRFTDFDREEKEIRYEVWDGSESMVPVTFDYTGW